MEIIPSLSILSGKLVRLQKGNYDRQTAYETSPLDFAKKLEDSGIRRIHFIDLEGARQRHIVNHSTLEMLAAQTKLRIDFGGGITSEKDVKQAFECGASAITVGHLALQQPDVFVAWLAAYGPEKVVLSADYKNGFVFIKSGVGQLTPKLHHNHISYFYNRSVDYVKCADVSRDGMLNGPSFELYEMLIDDFPSIKLLASGGIRSIEDLKALQRLGVHGAMLGKALYEGDLSLDEIKQYILSL